VIVELNLLEFEWEGWSKFSELLCAMKTLNMGMSDVQATVKEWMVYHRRPDAEITNAMGEIEHEWMNNKGGLVDKGPVISAQVQDYQDRLIRGETPDEAFHNSYLARSLAPAILGGHDETSATSDT